MVRHQIAGGWEKGRGFLKKVWGASKKAEGVKKSLTNKYCFVKVI
jgi:hypothetical protein